MEPAKYKFDRKVSSGGVIELKSGLRDHEWLRAYMRRTGIEGEIISAPEVQTVEKAAKRLGCGKKQIFKSVVFVDENGNGVIGIVDGESKVDKSKLEGLCGRRLRVAGRDEVSKLTGFSAGGVAPFGTGCEIFVDRSVIGQEIVFGGGGDENHLLKLKPSELLKEAKIADIAKNRI